MVFLLILTVLIGTGFIFVCGLLAYHRGFLTLTQMRRQGIDQGIPFMGHGATYSDLTIIIPLLALIISHYSKPWNIREIFISLAFGLLISAGMHWFYTKGTLMEAHVQNGRLTPTGWVHMIFMSGALAVFIQFYFFTQFVMPLDAGLVSFYLLIHLVIATHIPLGLMKRPWFPDRPHKHLPAWATIIGAGIIIGWRTYAILT